MATASSADSMRPPLPHIPNITKLSSQVTRVLGQNPGKFTLQGTNTYLIGQAPSLLLFDTGAGHPEYIPELRTALQQYGPSTSVTDIVLSHYHPDHVEGLPSVLRLLSELKMAPPRVWKFPYPERDAWVENALKESTEGSFVKAGEELLHGFQAGETQTFANDLKFKVVHTPGHTADSISLLFPTLGVLFTADTILGHGTPVFENLSVYMATLERCVAELKENGNVHLYPGHGEVVKDGLGKVKEYILHRQDREDQVMEKLSLGTPGQELTAASLTKGIYLDTIPEALIPAATRGILLHLHKLEVDGKVDRRPGDSTDAPLPGWNDTWRLKVTDELKI